MKTSSRELKRVCYLIVFWLFLLHFIPGMAAGEETTVPNTSTLLKSRLKTVIVADYYPYTFVNKEGVPDGFSVDLANAVAKVMGMDLEIKIDTWERATRRLETGEIDFLPMMAYSKERDKVFDFSMPHTIAFDAFFTRKGSKRINSMEELKGQTVIVMKGDQAHNYLLSSGFVDSEHIILIDSLPEALRLLSSEKGDAALMPELVGLTLTNDLNLTNLTQSPVVVESYNRPFCFAVKDGNLLLLEQLNQGLSIVKKTGQYREIYDKWFGALEPKELSLKSVLKYIVGALLALLLIGSAFVLWSFSLRKQVTLRTKKLTEEIIERKNAEKLFRAVFEHSTVGKSLTAPDGKLLRVNKTFADMMGYEVEEVQQLDLAQITHPDDMDKSIECIRIIMTGEQITHRFEKRYIHKGGGIVWADVSTTLLCNEQGAPLYLITSIVDVTERKQADEEKMKLQAQLFRAQKLESVGRLAGGVAHDFNNMLGIILGYAEMALDQVEPTEPLHANLQEIRMAANRSADLTRQLLAFASRQTVAPKVLDLNDTLEGMLKMLRRLIGEDIDLAWLPGKNLWPVKLDPSQIDQILANLCVNARDALRGVGKVTIETCTISFDETYCADHLGFVPGQYVMLAVSDNGCGMDKEILANIFEPFFTTKDLGKGSGLGLATIYGIVKQNNGFINVYSEPDQGATFKIYLPRYMDTDVPEQKTVSVGAAATGHETILLVEDEKAILTMTTIMLELFGYTVLTASIPSQAISISESYSSRIDLLMTDVVMPEMSGRDLAEKLLDSNPNLKCLFMSGYTANVIACHGVLDKGVHFIHKPFKKQDLATKLREVLDNAKNTAQQ